MFFDTHCHLDRCAPGALAAARAAGVVHFVVPAVHRSAWDAVGALGSHGDVSVALGVHPEAIADGWEGLEAGLAAAHGAAVGEIGLDRRLADWDLQVAAFRAQLALADELTLPVLVHCVRAHAALIAELREARPRVPVVLHAFSGSAEVVGVLSELGCYFSFAGQISWGGARRIPLACAAVPKDRLLIETDAPYMAPEPHRGRSNQPAWLELVAQGVARARGESVDEIGRITTANARQIFGL